MPLNTLMCSGHLFQILTVWMESMVTTASVASPDYKLISSTEGDIWALARFPCPTLWHGISPRWSARTDAGPCLFPVFQGLLSFVDWNPKSWKLLFYIFSSFCSCFRWEEKSDLCYSMLARSRSPLSIELFTFHTHFCHGEIKRVWLYLFTSSSSFSELHKFLKNMNLWFTECLPCSILYISCQNEEA